MIKVLPELIFVANNNLGKLRFGDRLCWGGQTRWHCWRLELRQSAEMENSFVRIKRAIRWKFFWQWKIIFTDTRKVLVGKKDLCDTLNKKKRRGLASKLLWEAKTTSRGFWHQEHGAIHGGWYCCRMKRSCPSSWIPKSWSSSTAKADGLEVCVLLIVLSRPFGISWLNILFNLYIFTLKVSNHYQKPNLKDLNKISIFILLTWKWLLFVKHLLLLSSLEKFANSSSNDQKLFFYIWISCWVDFSEARQRKVMCYISLYRRLFLLQLTNVTWNTCGKGEMVMNWVGANFTPWV